jgi:hypothetical protein
MVSLFARCFLCLALLNLTACASMRTVDLQRAVQTSNARGVEIGRLVEVRTLDGQTVKFRVIDIDDKGIASNDAYYPFTDMQHLKVEDPAATDYNVEWVLGVLAAMALIALAVNSDSVSVCSGAPCPDD